VNCFACAEKVEDLEEEEEAMRAAGKEPDCPFASPFWWAGYSVWGDGNVGGKHADDKAKKDGGYNYDKFIEKYIQENDDEDAEPEEQKAGSGEKPVSLSMLGFISGLKDKGSHNDLNNEIKRDHNLREASHL
jgi:hypothetical protein